jgi:hypothetical protein
MPAQYRHQLCNSRDNLCKLRAATVKLTTRLFGTPQFDYIHCREWPKLTGRQNLGADDLPLLHVDGKDARPVKHAGSKTTISLVLLCFCQ